LRNWYFDITKTQRIADNQKANKLVMPPKQPKEQQVKNRTQTYVDSTGICHVSNSPGGEKEPFFANKFNVEMHYSKLRCLLEGQRESYANDEVINYISSMANECIDQKNVILMRQNNKTIKRFYLNSFFIQTLCFDTSSTSAIREGDENSFNYLQVRDTIFSLFYHCSIPIFLPPYF